MSIMDRLMKNTTIKDTSILATSKFFHEKDTTPTSVPAINIALSGNIDGGFTSGLTMFAGPSKHFKTAFTLLMIKAYLDKHPEAICLYYDSEFGTPQDYFKSFDIDMNRLIHTPIVNVEELKFDLTKQLDEIKRGDKVFIAVDSIGNLASKKEVDDALEGKSTADMSRAKQLKSLFRIVTPHLTMKELPMVVVNHVYLEQGAMYPKQIVSGGTGIYLSAQNIFIIGRQQEKEGTEITGYNFILNVEKSRFCKEKSKIPITVTYERGIDKWSGLLDIALDTGHVVKPSNGWYSRVNMKTGEVGATKYRERDTNNSDFWSMILNDDTFKQAVREKFQIAHDAIVSDDFED